MMNKLGPYELNSIITGDARELAEAIPDESIDLIFTDPVYSNIEDYAWLAETAARVLKPDRACLVWQGVKWIPDSLICLSNYLKYKWILIWYQSNKRGHADFGYPLFTPLIWMEKGQSKTYYPIQDIRSFAFTDREKHKWQKELNLLKYWLNAFSLEKQIIFDPFTGGGTVPAVCKMLGRNYLAFEIDPETADQARQRVANTQPPLPLIMPEQLEIALDH